MLSYNYTDTSGNAASTVTRTVTVVDTTAPVISLNGDESVSHEAGQLYLDDNATWGDHVDGSESITATGSVDIDTPGSYVLSYNYTDTSGNAASTVTRTVTVVDTTAPVITLNGEVSITHKVGNAYLDENATWSDHVDGAGTITATGSVDVDRLGSYVLSYNYTDSNGNAANTMVRNVYVENPELKSFQENWTNATPVNGLQGWWESPWMGFYYADSYPWMYHQNLGWIFVSMESAEGIWFFDHRLGWLWTNPQEYPALYLEKRDHWVYLDKGTAQTRVYDYEEEEWFEPDIPIQIFGNLDPENGGEIIGYGNYYRWDVVVLKAKAKDKFNFAGWSGAINSLEETIEFEALRDLQVDASFLSQPSESMETREVLDQAKAILDKMEHLSQHEKDKSLAELLLYGESPTSGLSIKKDE